MHILISNDDGVDAPGLHRLAEELSAIAQVTVVAPNWDQSGRSSSISLADPLRVKQISAHWWAVNGSPADCVKLALSGLIKHKPDMVISGINVGQNLGDDVIYSGTVGAAIEGRFLSYAPIAVSSVGKDNENFKVAAQYVRQLVEQTIKNPIAVGCVLNVNVPDLSTRDIQGIQVTRQGDRSFSEPLIRSQDGRFKEIFWLGDCGPISDGGSGTDFDAIANGYVSVTPLHVDMTAHQEIDALSQWVSTMDLNGEKERKAV